MAAAMKTLASSRVATQSAVRPARATVVVRAQAQETSSRRALLGLIATGVAAAVALPQQASALVVPSQESYGGLGRATGKAGSSPKSPTRASMEGYTLEGTKKSGVSPKRKAKLLAKARQAAEAQSKK